MREDHPVGETRPDKPGLETWGTAHRHALGREAGELSLILAPDLTIVDATDAYLLATFTRRDEIRGCRMFDVFPDNPHDVTADGVRNLRESFNHVLERGEPDRMAIQRYDVRDYLADDGMWVEKCWAPVNVPVFASGSRELTHVLHRVEDVTQAVLLRRSLEEQSLAIAEQIDTLDRMRQELVLRQGQAEAAQESLAGMLRAGHLREPLVATLCRQFGAPATRQYWPPGHHAPMTGIYVLIHDRGCMVSSREVYLRAGLPFRRCPGCPGDVLYRLVCAIR